jgi:hypothetical protein
MTRFFGSLISLPDHEITTKNVSAKRTAVTSSISVISKNTGGSILSYLWQTTGNVCTTDTPSSSSTRVTGGGVSGKTQLFCKILNPITGVTITTPICIITWDPPTLIKSVNWSINSATTSTYNGAAQSPTVVSIDPTSTTYSTSTITATNAGGVASTTITGTLDHEGTFTSPNLTIVPSIINISAVNTTSFSYNGSSKTLDYSVNGVFAADQNYAVSGISFTNAGSYTATLTTSSNNYALGTSSIPWSISKALLTITTNNASMTYGTSVPTQTFGYTLSGLLGTDTENVVTGLNGISVGSATHSTTGTSSSNVGSYPITTNVSGLSATNYTFSAVNGTLTISAATLNITAAVTSFIYNGTSQSLSYSVTGTGVDTGYSVSGTTASTNTGSYTATLTKSSTNYVLGTSSVNWSIGKAALTITVNNASMTYGSSLPSFSFTHAGFKGSDTASAIITTTPVTFTTTGSSSASVGTYAITPVVSGLSATNYTFTPANGTLTINAASLTATGTTGSATFNGSSQSVTVISGINGTHSGSTSISGTNAGSYTTIITGSGNYTGTVTGTLTINPASLSASNRTGSTTYNGSSQSVTVLSGINGTYSGSPNVSGTNAGSYSTTITGSGNYTGSVTGTLTIHPAAASSSPASGITTYQVYDGTTKSASVFSGLGGLSYSGNHIASGVNAGTYSSTVTLGGNYSGSLTGYLVISPAVGDISLYFGGYVPAGDTNTKLFSSYLQRANASYTWSHSVSGPGAGDAYVQPGYGVQSTSYATSGFVVTITATISDPNYSASSATTSITFEAYVAPPPPSGGGGYGGDGGFVAE